MTHYDPFALLNETEAETGLHDWGDGGFKACLAAYCDALESDLTQTDAEAAATRTQIKNTLRRRLELYRDRASYPAIAAQRIERPLVVIGLPRSGTTFLHALLAQDPRARSPLTWEVGEFSPPPRAETHDTDPRIAPVQARLDMLPLEFKQMHMVGAKLPEECNSFTGLAFQTVNLFAAQPLPSFFNWYMQADYSPAYSVHKHILQHLQAFCARDWWVLKSPPHMLHLEKLIDTYPDARLIFPHRDPAATITSNASLIAHLRTRGGQVDKVAVAREVLAEWSEALQRTLAFRAKPGNEKYFIDVNYDAVTQDPLTQARKVYAACGLRLTPEAEAAMTAFLDAQPQDKHGAHRYTPEEFGLTAADLRQHFKGYIDTYGIGVSG